MFWKLPQTFNFSKAALFWLWKFVIKLRYCCLLLQFARKKAAELEDFQGSTASLGDGVLGKKIYSILWHFFEEVRERDCFSVKGARSWLTLPQLERKKTLVTTGCWQSLPSRFIQSSKPLKRELSNCWNAVSSHNSRQYVTKTPCDCRLLQRRAPLQGK